LAAAAVNWLFAPVLVFVAPMMARDVMKAVVVDAVPSSYVLKTVLIQGQGKSKGYLIITLIIVNAAALRKTNSTMLQPSLTRGLS
jgi:hypothetical protein